MSDKIAELRREYSLKTLLESDVPASPWPLFRDWFEEAQEVAVLEPNAMALATVDPMGQPTVRVVLLKGLDERGLVFYTNYESRKARELEQNPKASLCFWWGELERQVRIEGVVAPISAEESDAYFASRPRATQLGAWASDQSRAIVNREALEARLKEVEEKFGDGPVPRPEHWGGYRLRPKAFEFWQGRRSRLHDRLRYRLGPEDEWQLERLAP